MKTIKLGLVALLAAAACNNTNPSTPQIDVFAAVPATIAPGQSATLVWGVSGTVNKLTLAPGGDVTGNSIVVTPAATTQYTLTATGGGNSVTASTTVTVGAAAPSTAVRFSVTLPASVTAGTAASATVKAVDSGGNTVTGYTGTAHFTSDDASAVLPADVTYNAAAAGSATVSVTFKTAGGHTLLVSDGTIAGFGTTTVSGTTAGGVAASVSFDFPSTEKAGDDNDGTVTVLDQLGNPAQGYSGTLHFSTTDQNASVVLQGDLTFVAGTPTQDIHATLITAGNQVIFATDSANHISGQTPVLVTPAAFDSCTVGVVGLDPAPLGVSRKNGTRIRRSTAPGLSLPVPAGTLLPVEVTLYDAYGNIATGNDEVMRISTSDEAAIVSNPVVFTAGDPAQHDFSLQFHTAYTPGWDLNASMDDADFGCSAPGVYPVSHGPFTAIETEFIQNCDLRPQGRAPFVNPQPGCPPLSGDVWAGQNVLLFAAEVDPYNNTIDDSTDTLCVTAPNDATFQQQTAGLTGNSGQTFINTSFGAVGLQTATVSVCEGVMQGTAGPLNVHGFVYTDPPNADSAPISLIQSSGATASAMMLDLAVPDGAELNRVFSAGVDIPINGGIGGVQIAKAALDVGTGTQAIAAAIGGPQGNLLLAGASHKRAGAGAQPNDASFSDLDSAFTLTLQLGEASYPFVVFDGANLGPGFRAGVRDHLGNEVVHSWQVGIGKLEIR